ncbi:hypothetical protein KAR91_32910 [Candidatus Pacearchaeota archaeon]|nr:hypothetical protein [Candidatus Pacearchaeota archaeon]
MKKWYVSKTIWVNVVAVMTSVVASRFGYNLSADIQVGILTGINIILRKVTKSEIIW